MAIVTKLKLYTKDVADAGCNNGNYLDYQLRDEDGNIIRKGVTCRCHKGCANTDDVSAYEWGGYIDLEGRDSKKKRVVSLYTKGKPHEVWTENMTPGELDVLKLKILLGETNLRIESIGPTVDVEDEEY